MNVLIIGNGGREHALAWKVAQSQAVTTVFVAPGNAGTAREPKVKNIAIEVSAQEELLEFAKQKHIGLTIVGPELPLAAGLVDTFQQHGLACFGPCRAAAQLESSKKFAKDFMLRHHIPTAHYASFTDAAAAIAFVRNATFPQVIKASGLASGKGVVIAQNFQEAEHAILNMMVTENFGQAGKELVIEEFLTGQEASFIVMVDGEHILPLASSQDHKTRDDGDLGPNTGGMGAYSPAPIVNSMLEQSVIETIIRPTIQGLRAEGISYTGFLYAGLMIDEHGNTKVLEFNCRLGDPETQPLMMRLQSDLVPVIEKALCGQLDHVQLQWDPRIAMTVVLTAAGYPGQYPQGEQIFGLDQLQDIPDVKVFHAGTKLLEDSKIVVTAGGRVLGVTALGETFLQAQMKAYEISKQISWEHLYYRTDIGYRAVASERAGTVGS